MEGQFQMDMETYRKKLGLNKSGLVELAKSPKHFENALQNPKEPTPAMLKGTHFHTRVLEPELWAKTYIADPKMPKKKNVDKAAWEKWQEEHQGMTIVPQEEIDGINAMYESVMANKYARLMLEGGEPEISVFWRDPDYGFQCKLRADCLQPRYSTIIDLKTTNDISEEAIKRTVSNFKYHWQDYWYKRGLNAIEPGTFEVFLFIFVESKPPYAVINRYLEEDSLAVAQKEVEPLLHLYNECLDADKWPGPPEEIQATGLPQWHKNRVLFD